MKNTLPIFLMTLLGVFLVSCDKKGSAMEELRQRGIIQNELKINDLDEKGMTPLHNAIRMKNEECTMLLLDAGADINTKTPDGVSPLTLAIYQGQKDVVKAMLKGKAQVDGALPLTAAIMNNMPEFVEDLLEAGADTEPYDSKILSPLLACILKEDKESFRLVLRRIVEVDKRILDTSSEYYYHEKEKAHLTPLTLAIDLGQDDVVQALLEAGASIKERGVDFCTPIALAAKKGKTKYVKQLLPYCRKNKEVCADALVEAAQLEKPQCLKLLLETDCLDTKFDMFETPPLLEMARSARVENIELVLAHKVNINAKDKHGETALSTALGRRRSDVAQLLINAGADVNAENGSQETLLEQAIAKKDTETVEFLLRNKANPNTIDRYGDPLLRVALSNKNLPIAERLIKAGADVNAKDKTGDPLINIPLLSKESILLLLRNGADLNATDKSGKNVLRHNKYNGEFTEALESIIK